MRTEVIMWAGHRVEATIPQPLSELEVAASAATAATRRAAVALQRADEQLPSGFEPLIRLLMRAEGIASSNIEGIAAVPRDVALAEVDPRAAGVSVLVAGNLRAIRDAMRSARVAPLTVADLHAWHRALMKSSDSLPVEQWGSLRTAQSWIGGHSPRDAAFVGPPAAYVAELMDDLVAFANRTDIDAVAQAAITHVQFESIHPYGDGNGRIGRVLVGWILTRRLGLRTPPPVSVRVAADIGGYLAGMTLWRQNLTTPWISWFATVCERSAVTVLELADRVLALEAEWREQLQDVRSDSVAWRVVGFLPEMPVLNAAMVSKRTGVSERACRQALALLATRGILEPWRVDRRGQGRPVSWWLAPELLRAVE